jgi:hypothetical protein
MTLNHRVSSLQHLPLKRPYVFSWTQHKLWHLLWLCDTMSLSQKDKREFLNFHGDRQCEIKVLHLHYGTHFVLELVSIGTRICVCSFSIHFDNVQDLRNLSNSTILSWF